MFVCVAQTIVVQFSAAEASSLLFLESSSFSFASIIWLHFWLLNHFAQQIVSCQRCSIFWFRQIVFHFHLLCLRRIRMFNRFELLSCLIGAPLTFSICLSSHPKSRSQCGWDANFSWQARIPTRKFFYSNSYSTIFPDWSNRVAFRAANTRF